MHEDDCDPLPLTESRTCLKHPGPLSTHPVSSVLKREPMTRTSFGTASILWTLAILLRHSKLCTAMRATMDAEMQKTSYSLLCLLVVCQKMRAGRVGKCNTDVQQVGRSIPFPSLLFLFNAL